MYVGILNGHKSGKSKNAWAVQYETGRSEKIGRGGGRRSQFIDPCLILGVLRSTLYLGGIRLVTSARFVLLTRRRIKPFLHTISNFSHTYHAESPPTFGRSSHFPQITSGTKFLRSRDRGGVTSSKTSMYKMCF